MAAKMRFRTVEPGLVQGIDAVTGTVYPTFYARFSIRGQRCFESTHTTSLKQARLYLAQRQLEGAKGEAPGLARLTVTQLLDALEQRYQLNGQLDRTKRRHLQDFRDALGRFHPGDLVTPAVDRIAQLQATWKRAGMTNPTINRRCNILRKALRDAYRRKHIAAVPWIERLDESDRPMGRPVPLADAERWAAELPPRLRPVFWVAYEIGTRKGQFLRTKRDDVTLTPGAETIAWQPGEAKARRAHVVPLWGRARDLVRAAMAVAPLGCPYLFHGEDCGKPGQRVSRDYGCVGDFKRAFAAAAARAGIPCGRKAGGYTFHSLRHSAATNLRERGLEVADVMRVTGHKTTVAFQRYDHMGLAPLRAKLEAAVPDLPPAAPAATSPPVPAGRAARRDRVRRATCEGRVRVVR